MLLFAFGCSGFYVCFSMRIVEVLVVVKVVYTRIFLSIDVDVDSVIFFISYLTSVILLLLVCAIVHDIYILFA